MRIVIDIPDAKDCTAALKAALEACDANDIDPNFEGRAVKLYNYKGERIAELEVEDD